MSSDERFKERFLSRLDRLGEDGWHVRTSLLAFDYSIPETKVREMLLQWAQEGTIWLGADDGDSVRPWNQWTNTDEMFWVDGGQVQIRPAPPGSESVSDATAKVRTLAG